MLVPSKTRTEGSLELVRAENLPKNDKRNMQKNFHGVFKWIELNESETMNG